MGVQPEHIEGGAVVAGGAVLLQLVKWAKGKRQADARAAKDDADSAATIAGAWQTLLAPLQEEVARLAKQHEECERREAEGKLERQAMAEVIAELKRDMDALKSKGT